MSRNLCRMVADLAAATGPELEAVYRGISEDEWHPVHQAGKLARHSASATRFRLRSPLEDHMVSALYLELIARKIIPYDGRLVAKDDRFPDWLAASVSIPKVDIRCNRRIDRFVFDFTLETSGRRATVECDGLAWHWGRQQERDREKDELAAARGYRMFRYVSKVLLADRGRVRAAGRRLYLRRYRMSSAADRIAEIEKSAIPGRILKGCKNLGDAYRAGQRCLSSWSRICPCQNPTDFCQIKVKIVRLMDEYYGGPPFGLAGHEPFYVIEAMTASQFKATGLTATVEPPGGTQIKVGIKGTTWKTIIDLGALQDDDAVLAVAIDAVVKLQKADAR